MLYSEIISVCSEIRTQHTNRLCGQNVECLHSDLSSALDGGEWLTSDPGRLRTGAL